MKPSLLIRSLLIAGLVAMAGAAAAQDEAPEAVPEGLQLIDDTNLALVYILPDVDMSRYARIFLETPYIAFKENWQREQNRKWQSKRVSTDDMERIKSELASLFMDVFSKTLGDSGYQLTTAAGADVLLIKPAIINLDIVAPDTRSPGNTYSYSETAGEMTLYMEFYDSVSGQLIAKALDRKRDRITGSFRWRNKVSNRAAANRILQVWADVLKEGLDDSGVSRPGGN